MNIQPSVLVDEFDERSVLQLDCSLDDSSLPLNREGRVVSKWSLAVPDQIEETLGRGLVQPPVDRSYSLKLGEPQEGAEME